MTGSLLGLGGLGLAGCAQTLPPIDASSSSFGRGATGTVEVGGRSATQLGLVATVEAFDAANPDLRVNVTPVPDARYVTKPATAIRGGEPPDVVDIDDVNSPLFIFRETFADLTDPLRRLDHYDPLSPGHLRLLEREGRTFGIPYPADDSMLFVNTELFDRVGVDVASTPTGFEGSSCW